MNLSRNFTLAELCKTQVRGVDNTPGPNETAKLRMVANYILQPVRDKFGPVTVNSGFRCLAVNTAVGSKPTSQHVRGEAADFEVHGISNYFVAEWIRDHLDFDQLILECYVPGGDPNSGWVHCSYVSPEKNRKQCLTFDGHKYMPGLVV